MSVQKSAPRRTMAEYVSRVDRNKAQENKMGDETDDDLDLTGDDDDNMATSLLKRLLKNQKLLMKDQKELREEQKAMRALIESPSPSKARGINHAVQRCIRQLLFTGCFKDYFTCDKRLGTLKSLSSVYDKVVADRATTRARAEDDTKYATTKTNTIIATKLRVLLGLKSKHNEGTRPHLPSLLEPTLSLVDIDKLCKFLLQGLIDDVDSRATKNALRYFVVRLVAWAFEELYVQERGNHDAFVNEVKPRIWHCVEELSIHYQSLSPEMRQKWYDDEVQQLHDLLQKHYHVEKKGDKNKPEMKLDQSEDGEREEDLVSLEDEDAGPQGDKENSPRKRSRGSGASSSSDSSPPKSRALEPVHTRRVHAGAGAGAGAGGTPRPQRGRTPLAHVGFDGVDVSDDSLDTE